MTQRPSSPSAELSVSRNAEETASCVAGSAERAKSPAATFHPPHEVEREVQSRLQNHPALKFSRLHVHQCQEGICLEGYLESNEYEIDLCDVARSVEGVKGVLNRVVMTRPGSTVPKKG